MTIGATAPKNGSFVDLSVTGTLSFDAAQGTAGQVLTSAGSGATPTWTTPTTGTVTSVAALTLGTSGTDLLPVHKSASGGERSRVMLALEVVLAASAEGTTMVFDEIDAGVGGRAAVQIGRRLARLARTHQVIVVTHLPQVAAYADTHLVVDSAGGGASEVLRLDDEQRVVELARMLAGLGDSDTGRAHARDLLTSARDEAREEPETP